ncbi:MAG TPA: MFS transporter [Ktedonobacterales bacterium]|nr:MFS transporter [Ktedonobacterales bacterium]
MSAHPPEGANTGTPGADAAAKKASRTAILMVALVVLVDITGFGLILPLLPFWAERLGANPFEVGLILSVYALAQFLFTPVLGALSDRFGRRPVILISLLIEAAGFALTALAGTLPFLLVARFIGGLGASNIGSAQAVVADVTAPKDRARGMGMVGAAIGVGFVIGPALGGVLASFGPTVPFWAALVVALLNALLVLFLLPETRGKRPVAVQGAKQQFALFAGWQRAIRTPAIARLILVNLLFTLAFTAMEAVYPLFSQDVFGWGATQNGYIFTYVGVIIVIMQGGMVGQLVKRFGERGLQIAGLGLLAVGLALLPFSGTLALMLVALALLSIGDGAVTPTNNALLSLATPPEAQGETLGLSQGIAGLGRMIAPLIAGALFSVGIGLPFVVGAGLAVVAMLVALPRIAMPSHARSIETDSVQPAEASTMEPSRS